MQPLNNSYTNNRKIRDYEDNISKLTFFMDRVLEIDKKDKVCKTKTLVYCLLAYIILVTLINVSITDEKLSSTILIVVAMAYAGFNCYSLGRSRLYRQMLENALDESNTTYDELLQTEKQNNEIQKTSKN